MTENPSLLQIHLDHNNKSSDKWSIYLAIYDTLFKSIREHAINLLEIGIQNGGSLEIWGKYFRHANTITGVDINESCKQLNFNNERIRIIIGDASNEITEQKTLQIAPSFDIIIDDGSHRSGDIIKTFCRYFSHLKHDGFFIVEDLHCSYWREFDGGLFNEKSSVSFFKLLCDTINHEHWGTTRSRSKLLQPITQFYNCEIAEEALEEIHSIEFFNSVCVIKKKPKNLNNLGLRLVTGKFEPVVTGNIKLHQSTCNAPPQSDEASSLSEILQARLTESENIRHRQLRELTERCSQLLMEITTLGNTISSMKNSSSWRMTAPYRSCRDFIKALKR